MMIRENFHILLFSQIFRGAACFLFRFNVSCERTVKYGFTGGYI